MKLLTIEPSPSHLSPITGSHTAGDTKGILSAKAATGEQRALHRMFVKLCLHLKAWESMASILMYSGSAVSHSVIGPPCVSTPHTPNGSDWQPSLGNGHRCSLFTIRSPHADARFVGRWFWPLSSEGSHFSGDLAGSALTGWEVDREVRMPSKGEAERACTGPQVTPPQQVTAQHLPYTSWEFCCFSSCTMSTTMARKDLSLMYPVGGRAGHPQNRRLTATTVAEGKEAPSKPFCGQ